MTRKMSRIRVDEREFRAKKLERGSMLNRW